MQNPPESRSQPLIYIDLRQTDPEELGFLAVWAICHRARSRAKCSLLLHHRTTTFVMLQRRGDRSRSILPPLARGPAVG